METPDKESTYTVAEWLTDYNWYVKNILPSPSLEKQRKNLQIVAGYFRNKYAPDGVQRCVRFIAAMSYLGRNFAEQGAEVSTHLIEALWSIYHARPNESLSDEPAVDVVTQIAAFCAEDPRNKSA